MQLGGRKDEGAGEPALSTDGRPRRSGPNLRLVANGQTVKELIGVIVWSCCTLSLPPSPAAAFTQIPKVPLRRTSRDDHPEPPGLDR